VRQLIRKAIRAQEDAEKKKKKLVRHDNGSDGEVETDKQNDDDIDDDEDGSQVEHSDVSPETVLSVTVPCWPQELQDESPFLLRKPQLKVPWIRPHPTPSSSTFTTTTTTTTTATSATATTASSSSSSSSVVGAKQAVRAAAGVEGYAPTELPAQVGAVVALRATCATHLRFWRPTNDNNDDDDDNDDGEEEPPHAGAGSASLLVPALLPLISITIPVSISGDLRAFPGGTAYTSQHLLVPPEIMCRVRFFSSIFLTFAPVFLFFTTLFVDTSYERHIFEPAVVWQNFRGRARECSHWHDVYLSMLWCVLVRARTKRNR